MQKKRGQITLFILVGIVLIFSIAVFFVMLRLAPAIQPKQIITVPYAFEPIKTYIDSCIQKTAEQGIKKISLQGGFVSDQREYFHTLDGPVAYWYDEGTDLKATDEEVAIELSKYIEENLLTCINNFSYFPKNIKYETVSASASIGREKVIAKVNFPVKLIEKDNVVEVNDYDATVDIGLEKLLMGSRSVVQMLLDNPGFIDYTFLRDLESEGYDVKINRFSKKYVIWKISHETVKLTNNKPLIFQFTTRFYWSDKMEEYSDQPPKLMLDDFAVISGQQVSFFANATDPDDTNLTFESSCALFDITKDGLIDFTPTVSGEYLCLVEVFDPFALSDYEYITVTVT